jgi:hypothetical protein
MVLMAWWAGSTVWGAIQDWRAGRPVDIARLLALPACALVGAVFLVLLDPRNARYIVSPLDLLSSPQSEVINSSDHLRWVVENVPIVLTAVVPPLNLVPGRFADSSGHLLADYRYSLLPTVLVPLFLLGLGVVIGGIRRSSQARLAVLLLAVTLGGPLFSQGASISAVRMLYGVVPLSLCVAAGAGWLLARRAPAVRYGAAGLLAVVLAIQASQLWAEVTQHRAFVDDLAGRWSPGVSLQALAGPIDRWVNPRDELLTNGSYRYYLEEGGLPTLVAARRFKEKVPEPERPNEVVLVQLDGPVQRNDPAGLARLVFFLREIGVSAALFDPTMQQLRGSGAERPAFVLAGNNAAASGARRQLESMGLTVRARDFKP